MTCKVRGRRQSYVTIGLRFAAIDEGPLITPALLELLPAPALRRIAGYRRGESDRRSAVRPVDIRAPLRR